MAFLSKDTLIQAYKVLSTNTENPSSQGATQLISAVRYLFALDQFFVSAKKDCDTKVDADKNSFVSNVGQVVSLSDGTYTSNFYNAIKNDSDYKVGSNFFSVNAVNNSLVNPTLIVEFPKRTPKIMTIQNGVLKRDTSLFRNIGSYLRSNYARIAFALWLVRNENVKLLTDALTWTDVRTKLLDKYSSDLVDELVQPGSTFFNDYCTQYGQPATDSMPAIINKEDIVSLFSSTDEDTEMSQYNLPLQTIYYGAPGTGKSYKANEILKKYTDTIRTTFHPDSDYASFVGCYKPIEKEETRTFVHWDPVNQEPVLLKVSNKTGIPELDKEKKITYQFTQQAFLKAYIQAWKKMCHAAFPMSIAGVCFSASGKSYTVKSVETDKIVLRYVREITKKDVEKRWSKRLSSGKFEWPNSNISSDTQTDSICKWIFETFVYSETQLPEDWWEKVLSKLEEDVTINGKSDTTVYVLNKKGEKIFIANDDMFCKKETLQEYYNDESKDGYESYSKVAGILRDINSDDFETAWQGLKEKVENVNQCTETNTFNPQYLVIEEINRGNCAQIFGDIFQLLDRNDAGFSTYPIVPDADITKELKKELESTFELYDDATKNFIDNLFTDADGNPITYEIDGKERRGGTLEAVLNGKILVLPCNLNLLATMNTSDQSLFPMDSAFKRRWDWEYVAITNAEKNWQIKIDENDKLIDWWNFLQSINKVIADLTTSEDKQLGYFFTKPDEFVEKDETKRAADAQRDLISAKRFVSKVIFYLWNDVFKNNSFEHDCCKDDAGKEVLYAKFYAENGKDINLDVLRRFFMKLKDENGNPLL